MVFAICHLLFNAVHQHISLSQTIAQTTHVELQVTFCCVSSTRFRSHLQEFPIASRISRPASKSMTPESEENATGGRAESDIPTSGQPMSEGVDEGPPDAHPSGRTSPGQSSPTPAPRSQTNVSNNDSAHPSNGGGGPKGKNGSPSTDDVGDSKDVLEEFGWDDLEDRFCAAMDKFKKIEEDIGEEFREWLEVGFYREIRHLLYGLLSLRRFSPLGRL